MAGYFVERQYWMHWPKVLLMCRKHSDGIERRRYVPDKGTCEDASGGDPCAFVCSCCGATFDHPEDERVRYCPNCGRRVEQ